jgi:hypothetical protein
LILQAVWVVALAEATKALEHLAIHDVAARTRERNTRNRTSRNQLLALFVPALTD